MEGQINPKPETHPPTCTGFMNPQLGGLGGKTQSRELGELPGRRIGKRDGAQCGKLESPAAVARIRGGAHILSPNMDGRFLRVPRNTRVPKIRLVVINQK